MVFWVERYCVAGSNADLLREEENNADIERTFGGMVVVKETANGKGLVRGSMYCSFWGFHGGCKTNARICDLDIRFRW